MRSIFLRTALVGAALNLAGCVGNNPVAGSSSSSSASSSSSSSSSSSGVALICPPGQVERPSIPTGTTVCKKPDDGYLTCRSAYAGDLNAAYTQGSMVDYIYDSACGPRRSLSSSSSSGANSSSSSSTGSGSTSSSGVAFYAPLDGANIRVKPVNILDGYEVAGCKGSDFELPRFLDVSEKTVFSNSQVITHFIELASSKISFEIFLEETQVKTLALSAGQSDCRENAGVATNIQPGGETQFYNFETRTISPGKWTEFESSVELSNPELGDQKGIFIRVLDEGKFRIRQLKITTPATGEVIQLLP